MAVKRVLTGMRTTGQLHLGHYVGALKLWKEIQDRREYECFFLLADVQALTTHADNPSLIKESITDVVLDWLSVGLDPDLEKVYFVLQSGIPARFELSQYLMMLATYMEVRRNPTVKAELKTIRSPSMGFMTYPVDQVADIEMISPEPGNRNEILVPVGEDQAPHLEYARRLTRRFNETYGKVLVPCRAEIGEIGRLVGTDGSDKMSKSKGNAIYLADSTNDVTQKIMKMYTDPKRIRATDPGTVEDNPLFIYFDAFAQNEAEVEEYKRQYRAGKVGDVVLKKRLAVVINEMLDPIRERRKKFNKELAVEVIRYGTRATNVVADETLDRVKSAMGLFS